MEPNTEQPIPNVVSTNDQDVSFEQLSAPRMARGPYLQCGTDTSIIVRWATDRPTPSAVWVGDDPSTVALIAFDPSLVTEHIVEFVGLSPDTRYYYAVGDSPGAPVFGGESYYFVTAPPEDARLSRPLRIWVVGDPGRGNVEQVEVRDAYQDFTKDRHTDLWLTLGDNAYEYGTLDQYQTKFFDIYPSMLRTSVVWTAFGNHDGYSSDSKTQTGPYFDLLTMPGYGEAGGVPSGTSAYYSFNYGNVHFICLDSFDGERSGGAMLDWLARDLAETKCDWVIAFFHHPPYTKGNHNSDTERELIEVREYILPILEAAGVDLVLLGHSHSYERSYLLNGHYGDSSSFTSTMIAQAGDGALVPYEKHHGVGNEGTVYLLTGSAGRADPVAPHPANIVSLSVPGSVYLEIDGAKLGATFLDNKGAVRDRFTIRKI